MFFRMSEHPPCSSSFDPDRHVDQSFIPVCGVAGRGSGVWTPSLGQGRPSGLVITCSDTQHEQ